MRSRLNQEYYTGCMSESSNDLGPKRYSKMDLDYLLGRLIPTRKSILTSKKGSRPLFLHLPKIIGRISRYGSVDQTRDLVGCHIPFTDAKRRTLLHRFLNQQRK